MTDVLVVASKVKAYGKTKDLRTSAEVVDALSKVVERTMDAAAEKAKAAGRKTIMAEDVV